MVEITIIGAGRQRVPLSYWSKYVRAREKNTKPIRAIEPLHAAAKYQV